MKAFLFTRICALVCHLCSRLPGSRRESCLGVKALGSMAGTLIWMRGAPGRRYEIRMEGCIGGCLGGGGGALVY